MRVLITGANRGIGHAVARRLAARGDDVIGTARGAMAEPGLTWEQVDVADPAAIAAMSGRIQGPIDLLVCNAGVFLDKGQHLDDGYAPWMWADSFAVNVSGVFLTIQALLPQLRLAEQGKIAIIASQMGSDTRAPGGSYVYRASKAAALNLGRNLATDLAPEGIAVGIYHPGWVQTDMGGSSAEITVEEAARGLVHRFDALTLVNTGLFETWDGRPHPY